MCLSLILRAFDFFLEIGASVKQYMLQDGFIILCSMNRVCDDLCDVLVLYTFVNGVFYGFIVAKG